MKFNLYAKMSHGNYSEMLDTKNQKEVASKSILKCFTTNDNSTEGCASPNLTNPINFNMCLREPMIVLDKNIVDQYYKMRKVPSNLLTVSSRQADTLHYNDTKIEEKSQILVISEKCEDYIRNRVSVHKDSSNRSVLIKEEKVILEGPILSQNNNLFQNINEYVAQQSVEIGSPRSYMETEISENYTYNHACNKNEFEDNHNFLNKKYTMFIKGDSIKMECGDDILYANGNNYYDENAVTTKAMSVEMECGDDILFTNDANYCNEDPVTTGAESVEMECGDDILFTDGAGYYNSDEDSAEGNQYFSDSYEAVKTNVLNDHTKQGLDVKNVNPPLTDIFQEQEGEFYHCKECHYKTFVEQELCSHVASQHTDFLNENFSVICEKCGKTFANLALLKKHQFETCGLKYFYTCKFCPSTSWYSSTLKNHIEAVHSRELGKENIDDIMENIERAKQVEKNQSNDPSSLQKSERKEHAPLTQARKKTSKKSKKKKFIRYNEIKGLLKVCCFECNMHPEFVRGRTEPQCSRCRTKFAFLCLNCSKFYLKYDSALLHAKRDCKGKKNQKIQASNNQMKKVHEKRPKTMPNKSDARKFFKSFCVRCNESLERRECSTEKVCRKCNKSSLKFQCEVCKKLFEVRIAAQRHSRVCHRAWRELLINSSLSTFALIDHNYYCKDVCETKIAKQIQQPQFIELNLPQQQSTRRVYSGKNSQSIQS